MPRHVDRLRLRLRSLFRSADADRDLARELRAHLDEEIATHIAAGRSPQEARRLALQAFGPIAPIEEQCRDTRRVTLIQNLSRDVRHAARTLAHQPGLLVAAALSIALGVGANLTIFALANSLLLSTPSAARPEELVIIRTGNGSHVPYAGWRMLDDSGALAGVAGYQFEQSINFRHGDVSTTLVPLLVTANFFDVVAPPLAFGRGFARSEAPAEANPRLVVVSDGFWRRYLNRDPGVIGRTVAINGEAYTVTGVLAQGARSVAGFGLAPDVYLPLSRELLPAIDRPNAAAAQLIGRLRRDQTVDEGRAATAVAAARIAIELNNGEFRTITEFAPVGGIAQGRELRAVAAFFLVLLVVSSLVLAIACANVAGLLLARGLSRRREIALRLALGASRARVVQQLLTESLVLVTAGVIAGGALTGVAFLALSRVALPIPVPVELQFVFDVRTIALALGLVLFSTCITGLAPALQATRRQLVPSLALNQQTGSRRLTVRSVLVAFQVAISVLLLVTALLFMRSLQRASSIDPGFDVDRLLVARVSFVEGRQGTAARPAVEDLADAIRATPGVTAAAFAEGVPLTIFSGDRVGTEVRIDGVETPVRVDYSGNRVGPGYFETMGIRLFRGRDFTPSDRVGAPRVIVVNAAFARRYFADRDPIGRRITQARWGVGGAEIVGVVANGTYRTLSEVQEPAIYEPILAEERPDRLVHLIVRAADPEGPALQAKESALHATLREAMRVVDPSAAVTLTPMREAVAFATLPSEMGSALLGVLGAIGTALAMVGLFGVVSFTVNRRTPEIAIRMALGASRAAVLRLVLTGAGRLIGAGIVVGLLLAWLVTAPLSAFLVAGVDPADPVSLAGAAIVLVLASVAAIWAPAIRATSVAPLRALRLD